MKSIPFIIFWAFLVLPIASDTLLARGLDKTAPPDNFFAVYNFENDWLVYSTKYKSYVPFSPYLDENSRSVSLNVDLVRNRKYYLLIRSEDEAYLFIEGTLQRKIEKDHWLELNVDSLHKVFGKEELLISMFGSSGVSGKMALICNKKGIETKDIGVLGASGLINIRPIFKTPFENFSVLFSILLLFTCGLLYNINPANFLRLLSFSDYFSKSERDQLAKLTKPGSQYVVIFVAALSMIMSYLFIFLKTSNPNLFEWFLFLSNSSTILLLFRDFGVLSIVFFVAINLKYFLMVLVANMLNLDKIMDVLFIKIIQSSFIFHGFLYLVVLVMSMNYLLTTVSVSQFFVIPLMIFYFIRFLTLYVIINPPGRFINLYLFSYLCVVEVIPLIIGMKFVL